MLQTLETVSEEIYVIGGAVSRIPLAVRGMSRVLLGSAFQVKGLAIGLYVPTI
jgi:hypothetical protein